MLNGILATKARSPYQASHQLASPPATTSPDPTDTVQTTSSSLRKWGMAAVGALALGAAALTAPATAHADTGIAFGPGGVMVWSTPNYPIAPHPIFYPASQGVSIDGNWHQFDQCNNVMDASGHYRFVTDGYNIVTAPPTICQWGY